MGGSEQVIVTLGERLAREGYSVAFALLRPGPLAEMLRQRGLRVYTFAEEYRYRNLGSVLRCIRWLTQCIQDEQADVLHSNLTAHFVGGWAARRAHIAEVWHLHDYPHRFDPVHFISQRIPTSVAIFTTEYLKSGEPQLARGPHVVVHPDCVDVDKLKQTPGDPSVRGRIELDDSRFFLTFTRLQEHKGHAVLVEAVAEIAAEYPDIKWVFAGKASGTEQLAYLVRLTSRAKELGLEDRILFPGFIADADVVPLFREAFALVHPAITEGYGLVLIEAMACGLPVIAAGASGPREILQDGIDGLIVAPGDSSALAVAMRTLLDDPARAESLRNEASVRVQNRSLDAMVARMQNLYEQLLSKNAER
jgi:glycosyltransferase involved in cell wall biosynthesis